ncbi:uncharacterized protein LOC113552820 [Rhopalosiphum maidis]|uniref:uncharacterized protein LOC113552820 n=1 Tax=Rhopalosiphum maidis TaxID=43146 RepID=UPI000EFF0725|nr:uncharacterized protein LOC113552820 [Rhopalosiphum maidis]
MSFITHYVVLISLAFVVVTCELQYPNETLQYLAKVEKATKSHHDSVKFLQAMMEVDYLWWPILNEKVRVKRPTVKYFNPYAKNAPDGNMEDVEVLALENITTLLQSNVFIGTDVRFTIDVIKTAIACSALKHISLEGLMLHQLMEKYSQTIPLEEKILFFKWLVDMIHVAIDKLTALDYSLVIINQMRQHLVDLYILLLQKKTDNLNTKVLKEIGLEMFTEIDNICVKPIEGEGHYSALITDLNRIKRIEDLKAHRSLITETMRDSTDMIDLDIINKIKGTINIDKQIDANGIDALDNEVLKRAYAANYVQMNFLFSNLPVHTLTESQWAKLFQLEKYTQLHVKPDSPKTPQSS